jgi:DNA-binding CsgD family transcriptional regulator
VGLAREGEHVVLAHRRERDVLHQHQPAVADVDRLALVRGRVLQVAGEHLGPHARHPSRYVEKAIAGGVRAHGCPQPAHGPVHADDVDRGGAPGRTVAHRPLGSVGGGPALPLDGAVELAMRGRGGRGRPTHGWDSLTPTEARVVDLVTEGLPNEEGARRLLVSPATVKIHLTHVYAKTGTSNRTELAARHRQR